MKVIEISNCSECPYKDSWWQIEPYCNRLTKLRFKQIFGGQLPEIDGKAFIVPEEGILPECPLKDK